jgi:hypothetical protein
MKNQKETIRKTVGFLNNADEHGGFWLPNIQRPFVWNEGQIERLFDSIMREYPISSLLTWKTKGPIRRRRFIDVYRHGLKLSDFYVPEDNSTKVLILDGQQRLQSLFIGLRGSYERRELYMNMLSGAWADPGDIRYQFKLIDPDSAEWPWVKFKDLVYSNERSNRLAASIAEQCNQTLSPEHRQIIEDNVAQIYKVFRGDDNIVYQELDSIDNPDNYTDDDIVEIFIRANSGGTVLGKSDLLFSLLVASWEDADERIEGLLDELNKGGYEFDRDFLLKTCLTVLDKGARYDVSKFRDGSTREAIINNWEDISEAIRAVKDYLHGKTYIRTDKALPSYLVLIPLVYFRYRYRDAWKGARGLDDYILRTLIAGSFSGNPDNLIDQCTKEINRTGDFVADEIFGVIRANGRTLEISKEALFEQHYGSKGIHLIFNMWYKDFDYHPAIEDAKPQVDHVFPQSLLKSVKTQNPSTGRMDMLKYRWDERDQIANCMLLTREENGPGGKGAKTPAEWFSAKSQQYLDMHLIPPDRDLWGLENFDRFIAKRKELIEQKFGFMLIKQ